MRAAFINHAFDGPELVELRSKPLRSILQSGGLSAVRAGEVAKLIVEEREAVMVVADVAMADHVGQKNLEKPIGDWSERDVSDWVSGALHMLCLCSIPLLLDASRCAI